MAANTPTTLGSNGAPLKAERIQLIVLVALSRADAAPADGDAPARARRVLDGWRRRTAGPVWKSRRIVRRAAS